MLLGYAVTLQIYQTVTARDFFAESVDDAIQQGNTYLSFFYKVPDQARALAAVLMPGFETVEEGGF